MLQPGPVEGNGAVPCLVLQLLCRAHILHCSRKNRELNCSSYLQPALLWSQHRSGASACNGASTTLEPASVPQGSGLSRTPGRSPP